MPKTETILFAEDDGSCPLLDWLDRLPQKAQDKCIVKIERLAEMGHELRRPEADYLQDQIYELRVALRGIQYRMLYFFCHDKGVLSHGLVKKGVVPRKEIDLAADRRSRYEKNPLKYTYRR